MEPVAYIRRSARSRTDPGDLSREFQTDKVRELANGDRDRLRIIDADWGRSASTDKTDQRVAFLALLDDVENGRVSALYAYATDRLARSVEWSARLLNACRRAGTVIVTSEGRFEPNNPLTDQLFYFAAMQNENYSRQAEQKRRATVERQRANGIALGPKHYGDLPGESADDVIAAFEEAGSAHGAAVLLNKRGIRTRRGGPWTHASVRKVLIWRGRRPPMTSRGVKPVAPFVLYRLLRCHCGRTLTGSVQRYGVGKARSRTIYRCVAATTIPDHGLATVPETTIVPWVREEAARLHTPERVELEADQDRKQAALEERRARVLDMYEAGAIDRDDYRGRLARVDAALGELEAARAIVDVPALDWSWPPEKINAVLRAMWERVELDAALQPVCAHWTVPEWRQ